MPLGTGISGYESIRLVDFRFPVLGWLGPLLTVTVQCACLAGPGILLFRDRHTRLGIGLVLGISAWVILPAVQTLTSPFPVLLGRTFWIPFAAGWLALTGGVLGLLAIRREKAAELEL